MAYTSRSDAREFKCPACNADTGEKCIGARGRVRESVHRERMNVAATALGHTPIATFRLEGDRLVDAEGATVGRLTHVEFDLQSETLAGNLRRGEGEGVVDVDVSSASSPETQTLSHGSAEGLNADPQTELLPDPVEETWALYAELLERPRAVLTPKVRRWIADAHKAVGAERTQDAIRGLAASEYHRDNGYIGIEYAIVAKRGETVEGRVEMMAAKAPKSTNGPATVDVLLARVPSEARPMVAQWVEDIEQSLRYPHQRGLAATAQTRISDLREKVKMEPVIENGRIVDWVIARD